MNSPVAPAGAASARVSASDAKRSERQLKTRPGERNARPLPFIPDRTSLSTRYSRSPSESWAPPGDSRNSEMPDQTRLSHAGTRLSRAFDGSTTGLTLDEQGVLL